MISTHENYTPASGENRVYEDEMKPSGLVAVADSVGTKCLRGDRETSGGRPHIVLTSEYLRYLCSSILALFCFYNRFGSR